MSCCDANWWCSLAARLEETPAVRKEIQNSTVIFTIAAERREHIFLVGRICINSSSSSFASSLATAALSEFTLWFTPWKLPSEKGAFRNSIVQENRTCVSLTYNVLESTIPTTFALWLKRISSKSFKSVEDGTKQCTCILVLARDKFWWGSWRRGGGIGTKT